MPKGFLHRFYLDLHGLLSATHAHSTVAAMQCSSCKSFRCPALAIRRTLFSVRRLAQSFVACEGILWAFTNLIVNPSIPKLPKPLLVMEVHVQSTFKQHVHGARSKMRLPDSLGSLAGGQIRDWTLLHVLQQHIADADA